MFDFILNSFSLFGILPGIILKVLDPKKSAVLGGILIVTSQMMICGMVSFEHAHIRDNSVIVFGTICALAG